MSARNFTDPADDGLYQCWMDEYPDQFVVNTHKTPKKEYLKLHQVGSCCLAYKNPLLDYSKLCGDRAGISDYVARCFGFDPLEIKDCGNCFRK